ncbi:MAG: hypothetical protein H7Y22_09040 [Gemmatimonadaceae bacterium]|nr:hypothetical protein [Gloeobacterales cyanobacterium ES-bin-141]
MTTLQRFRVVSTLSFGDVYGQIMIWIIIILLSLASSLALVATGRPNLAIAAVALFLVFSLPFLLFSFVTTLFNHIEVVATNAEGETEPAKAVYTNAKN